VKRNLVAVAFVTVLFASLWSCSEPSEPAPPARTIQVSKNTESGNLRKTVTATGAVHTVHNVDVGSQLSGKIEAVYVDFNDLVTTGQPLALLDQHSFEASLDGASAALAVAEAQVRISEAAVDRARASVAGSKAKIAFFEAQIARAKASLQEAQLALDRKKNLSTKGVLSQVELDEVKANLEKSKAEHNAALSEFKVQEQQITIEEADLKIAEGELLRAQSLIPQRQAALKLAEFELERTIIRSPIDGIVINRGIEPGQTVAASLEAPTLFTIAQDLEIMEVHTMIDETDIGKIEVGQKAVFSVDAYPDRNYAGEVRQIRKSPQTNRGVVSYVTIIKTENTDLSLLPGMTALVSISVVED